MNTRKPRRSGSGWIRRMLLIGIGLFVLVQLWFFAWVLVWKVTEPGPTQFMKIRLSELQKKNPNARLQQSWVPYANISTNLKHALIAAEDSKFMQHHGFDFDGIQKAFERMKSGDASQPAVPPSRSNWPRTSFSGRKRA